jgi:hypothetical protein
VSNTSWDGIPVGVEVAHHHDWRPTSIHAYFETDDGREIRLLLYAHRHRSILDLAGHITLTPANHLMVMNSKYGQKPGFKAVTFRSLAQHAYHLR